MEYSENVFESKSGLRFKCLNSQNKSILIRDDNSRVYIAQCAALALHKVLIGLTELTELEQIEKTTEFKEMYMSKAINIYYVIYHLFTFVMLLDDKYEIVTNWSKRVIENGIEHTTEEFDISCGSVVDWERKKYLEQDIATMISHGAIKKYCDELRKISCKGRNKVVNCIYKYFVLAEENEIAPVLYNKVCYVRDRVIYRPSNVIDLDNYYGVIQTSADLRKEIESLPSSKMLYEYVKQAYESCLDMQEDFFRIVISYFFQGTTGLEKTDDYEEAKLKKLIKIGKMELFENNRSLMNNVSHMMEIKTVEKIQEYDKLYWEPLRIMFIDKNRTKNGE